MLYKIQGGYVIIDEADYELVNKYEWFADRDGYATTFVKEPKFHSLRMHNLICPRENNMVTDHRNHIRLDNRRSNLQLLTLSQHARKRTPDSQDILYTQEQLLQRGTNNECFNNTKRSIKQFLKQLQLQTAE